MHFQHCSGMVYSVKNRNLVQLILGRGFDLNAIYIYIYIHKSTRPNFALNVPYIYNHIDK